MKFIFSKPRFFSKNLYWGSLLYLSKYISKIFKRCQEVSTQLATTIQAIKNCIEKDKTYLQFVSGLYIVGTDPEANCTHVALAVSMS